MRLGAMGMDGKPELESQAEAKSQHGKNKVRSIREIRCIVLNRTSIPKEREMRCILVEDQFPAIMLINVN